MPGTIPTLVYDATDPLLSAYRLIWQRITEEQARLLADPTRLVRVARLRELREAVERDMRELDAKADAWLSDTFPRLYAAGAARTADELGDVLTWTQFHQRAVADLASDLHSDLLSATRYVTKDTKRWVREAARLPTLYGGSIETATQAAKDLERSLRDHGIAAITYKDGSRHGLGEYSQMAVRTKTGVAYNRGTTNEARQHGINHLECFDGPECGWEEHDDPDLALGKIVTVDQADENPISHPNCRRGFGPRADIETPEDALAASGQVTEDQTRAQRAQDAERQAAQGRRALRRAAASSGRTR